MNGAAISADLGEAEARLRHVVNAEPGRAIGWMNLGIALRAQQRHAEAIEAFERAVDISSKTGDAVDAFVELATEYQLTGQNERAVTALEAHLAGQPSVEGYRAYAEVLLASGRLAEGWQHHEARWLVEPLLSTRLGPACPTWNGQDLSGKTVLLRVEQGFGDVIMALRYARFIQALGAEVVLGRFSDLAYGFAGVDRILPENASPQEFDFYIPVMSLPRVFGTDLGSIPAEVPYLHPEPARVEKWRKRLAGDGEIQVGLSWAGRPTHPWDKYRSMALSSLAPLWAVEGVRFVSLQKGAAAGDAQALAAMPLLVDLGPELEDFADTAAVISQLDIVICVDTAIAHLAGALGKPVWVMLAQPSDWRWMQDREDTPWYPTMRLFRQQRPGDWPDVVARVKAALEQRMRESSADTAGSAQPPAKSAPLRPKPTLARLAPGHKPGFCAVAETRVGIVQYFPDEPIIGDSVDWYGEYLQPQLDLIERLVGPGATLLEAGAGVGVHALHLAAAIGPGGRLLAYESRPLHRRVLRQNLAANRVANVTLMKRTLGATGEGVDLGCETVDELHLDQLRLLKTGEAAPAGELLAGAADTLWRLRPLLFVAARDKDDLEERSLQVKDFGYRCWKIETPLFNPANFNRRENDIFAGAATSALLAIPEEIDADLPLAGCPEL